MRKLKSKKGQKSFTLIELLVVIGIIAVLVGIAVVVINPGRQFAKANNVRRTHDLKQITSAIQQNMVDNRGPFACAAGDLPTDDTTCMGNPAQAPTAECLAYYDICNCLVPEYLPAMPADPQKGRYKDCGDYNTQYVIKEGSLILRAPLAQLTDEFGEIEIILPGDITIKGGSPSSFDFGLTVNPSSDSVVQGGNISAAVDANLISGTSQSVSFSASDIPTDASVSFLPPSCKPTCSSAVDISAAQTTPTGTYPIKITASGGGVVKETTYNLTVVKTPPCYCDPPTCTVRRGYGDVDGDGDVDNTDATRVAMGGLTGDDFKAADVNGDGFADSGDQGLFMQYIAGTITTFPVCVAPSNNAPIAEAGISLNGTTYSQSITVIQGKPVNIWLSADKDVNSDTLISRDPDGWTSANGVSSGGNCQWNTDLDAGNPPTYEQTISSPASATACNISLGSKTFNDASGAYTYRVLKITDNQGLPSNISTVTVNVVKGPPCYCDPPTCTVRRGYGDVDGDGDVDNTDKALAMTNPTGDAFKAADVNGDGFADSGDQGLFTQYIAGTITTFPVCP